MGGLSNPLLGTGAAAQEQYENKVLRPLLGGEHIHQGRYKHLPMQFVAALSQQHGLQLSRNAWVVQDHTVFEQRPALRSGMLLPCAHDRLAAKQAPAR